MNERRRRHPTGDGEPAGVRDQRRASRGATWGLGLIGMVLCGCVSVVTQVPATQHGFLDTLHDCRMQQPGRLNRRLALAATRPSIEQCLRRHGWKPDGSTVDGS